MKVAWDFIHPLAEEGLSNEEILQELGKDSALKYMLGKLGRELTTDEIGKLRVSIDRLVEHLVKHTPT
jgi:hypothetical protein